LFENTVGITRHKGRELQKGARLRDRLFKNTVGITRHKGRELRQNWCWQTQRFVQHESTN
jgi:hypothetical protein